MLVRNVSAAIVGVLTLAVTADSAPAGAQPNALLPLLQMQIGLTGPRVAANLKAGKVVTQFLSAHRKGEIAVGGALRIQVPLAFFLKNFSDVPILNRGPEALEIHEFSRPPRLQDLQSLMLSESDIRALPKCMPGHCALKLSAQMVEQAHASAPSGTRMPQAQEQQLFRSLIFQFVTAYAKNGNAAMITYADKLPPVNSADAFLQLLRQMDWLTMYSPPLQSCLETCSGQPCPHIESALSWSMVKFGLKPVFTITNSMINKTTLAGNPSAFVALNQIYADHYFDAALGLAVLVQESTDPAHPAIWLASGSLQIDGLRGWFGRIEKGIVQRKTRAALRKDLAALKADMEERYARRPQL